MEYQKAVAKALLEIGAVGFSPSEPITFTSGMLSPVYVDNRRFPFHPEHWKTVIEGFAQVIREENLAFDVIAGIEAAGIPHSSALAYQLGASSVFVRKKPKEHGTRSRLEGGEVSGKKVLLIEDLVTTGGSSLSGVEALREEGAAVDTCLVIVTYGFPESREAFKEAQVKLHALTSFDHILEEAVSSGKITREERESVERWTRDPHNWQP